MSWRERSACVDKDPELFFPIGSTGPTYDKQVAIALAVCASCDVQSICLEWALEKREDFGVWGGRTAEDRRELRKQQLPEWV